MEFFKDRAKPEGLVFFDLPKALENYITTPYHAARAKEILEGEDYHADIWPIESREGGRMIHAQASFTTPLGGERSDVILHGNVLDDITSTSEEEYWESEGFGEYIRKMYESEDLDPADDFDPMHPNPKLPLDEYKLVLLSRIWDYIERNAEQEQDQTDRAAQAFFKALEQSVREADKRTQEEITVETAAERAKVLVLVPRIIIENGDAVLSFKIGHVGGRLFVLKNLRGFAHSYQQQEPFDMTKKESIDFSQKDFTDETHPVAQFLVRRVGEVGAINEKLMYKGIGRGNALSMSSSLELKGTVLDNFYDLAEGKKSEYQDKTNQISEAHIPIGHRDMQFVLRADRIADARGTFAGVAVSGLIPVLLKGSTDYYILNREGLSRITPSERDLLQPFRRVADQSGYFRFCVGVKNLHEFYYRVLPQLMENPCVQLEDHCAQEAEKYLPPEPAFTFYLDYADGEVRCRCEVSYPDRMEEPSLKALPEGSGSAGSVKKQANTYIVQPPNVSQKDSKGTTVSGYRDEKQEKRIRNVLAEVFTGYRPAQECYCMEPDDDELYQLLQIGLPRLERYGQLQGTDAFKRQTAVNPLPLVQMGISVESGLMDLSVTSKELTREELLEVFASYRRKKRYHRLKSGAFIDLSDAGMLGEMDVLLQELDLSPEKVIGKKMQLPLYRALYLDRMLEEHDAVVTTRDRVYRALIRNFRTIRDAEYELPGSLEDTMRPYQNDGYKWLKTLEAAGFGGILADEMGLGKTVQMISVFLSDKEAGRTKPSLVVCPASLIFN